MSNKLDDFQTFCLLHPKLTRKECQEYLENLQSSPNVTPSSLPENTPIQPFRQPIGDTVRAVFKKSEVPSNDAIMKRISTKSDVNPLINITTGTPFISAFATDNVTSNNLRSL